MKIGWPHVVLVGIILGSITVMGAFGRDTSALIALGTVLLAGVGLTVGTVVAIKDQTNGQTSKLLQMVESMAGQLAAMQPPPAPPAAEEPTVEVPLEPARTFPAK